MENKELKPGLLSQPNIPKPLHGLNPRNIMGKEQWDSFRQDVYKSTGYHCAACGVHKSNAQKHQWLEAHEDFEIDYKNKTMNLRRIVPLCHYCHQFIHSGFLYVNLQKTGDSDHVINVLKHGFEILSQNNLPAFLFTLELANVLGVSNQGVKPMKNHQSTIEWDGWKMIWDGVEYKSKFKTHEDWKRFYNR